MERFHWVMVRLSIVTIAYKRKKRQESQNQRRYDKGSQSQEEKAL